MVVGKNEAGAVEPGDGRHEGEAETGARRRAARVQPGEAHGDELALRRRDARTVIGNRHLDLSVHAAGRDGDPAARRGMADAVLDQVGQQLVDQRLVAQDRRVVDHHEAEHLAALLGGGTVGIDHGLDERSQRDPAEPFGSGAGLDLRDLQQRGEGRQDPVDVARRRLDLLLQRRNGMALLPRQLEALPQAGQRRPEVVGDVVRHLLQAADQALDPFQHRVEAGGEMVELVVGAVQRDPARQVPAHDRAGGEADGLDPAQDDHAHQQAAAQAENRDPPEAPQCCTDQRVVHLGPDVRGDAHEKVARVRQDQPAAADRHAAARLRPGGRPVEAAPAGHGPDGGHVAGEHLTAPVLEKIEEPQGTAAELGDDRPEPLERPALRIGDDLGHLVRHRHVDLAGHEAVGDDADQAEHDQHRGGEDDRMDDDEAERGAPEQAMRDPLRVARAGSRAGLVRPGPDHAGRSPCRAPSGSGSAGPVPASPAGG